MKKLFLYLALVMFSFTSCAQYNKVVVKAQGVDTFSTVTPWRVDSVLNLLTAGNGLTKVGRQFRLGGTLSGNTTINSAGFTTIFTGANTSDVLSATSTSSAVAMKGTSSTGVGVFGINTSGGSGTVGQSTDGNGTYGIASTGIGVHASATTGIGVYSQTADGLAGSFTSANSSTNTVITILDLFRDNAATPANGIGESIDFNIRSSNQTKRLANQLISKFTNATDGTRTSQFILTGVNSATTADLMTVSGSGATRLNKYGVGTFAGTPAYTLAVDASGNLIETSSAASVTADNGLTVVSGTVKLGGTLLAGTTIGTGAFTFGVSTSNGGVTPFAVSSTTGGAISVSSTSGSGVTAIASSSGFGLVGVSSTGIGVQAWSNASYGLQVVANPSANSTVVPAILVTRQTTSGGGAGANGIGSSIDFDNAMTTGSTTSNRIISKWTNATTTAQTSQLIITGVNSAVAADLLTISGSGATQLNKYGGGTFTGTATFNLAVDASGNIIEVSTGGGGGGGITDLNGLTALSQTLVTGTSGSDFNISSVGSVHTFNLPNASASNRGALSTSDWIAFNAKQSAISFPNTTNKYFTGYGTFGSLLDTARQSITVTTVGTSGAATYNPATGVINIPTPTAASGVTSFTVASANGFAGSVTGGSTPVATISTTITGVLKGNGTAISAAVAGTDYVIPSGSITGTASNITGTLNASSFPALTGNVTTVAGSLVTTIAAGVVTNAMLAGGINLANKVTGILPAANGGTENGFTAFTGPTTSTKTFTLPNASATILTSNAAVTAVQGGTGIASYTLGDILAASGTTTLTKVAGNTTSTKMYLTQTGNGTISAVPTWAAITAGSISGLGALAVLNSVDLSGSQATGTLAAARMGALSGDVTSTAGSYATTIAANAVTVAKMQQIATNRLLGRSTAGTGNVEVITVGAGLSLAAGVLSAQNAVTSQEFTGSTSLVLTLSQTYISGSIKLYKNGVRLRPSDFTQTTATTITLTVPRLTTDIFLADFNY
jgi:hypothetical protein